MTDFASRDHLRGRHARRHADYPVSKALRGGTAQGPRRRSASAGPTASRRGPCSARYRRAIRRPRRSTAPSSPSSTSRSESASRTSSGTRRSSRASACSRAASRTTSTTCSSAILGNAVARARSVPARPADRPAARRDRSRRAARRRAHQADARLRRARRFVLEARRRQRAVVDEMCEAARRPVDPEARRSFTTTRQEGSRTVRRATRRRFARSCMNLVTNAAEAIGEATGRGRRFRSRHRHVSARASSSVRQRTRRSRARSVHRGERQRHRHGREHASRVFDPFFTTKFRAAGSEWRRCSASCAVTAARFRSRERARRVGRRVASSSRRSAVATQSTLPSGRQVERGRGVVLVVDDDAGIQSLVRRALSNKGYRVSAARTESKGVGLYQQYKSASLV